MLLDSIAGNPAAGSSGDGQASHAAGGRHRDFSLFFAGACQTTFLSSVATLLQMNTDENNRGRIMSMFGLINRGLGPMGTFPFGLLATGIGAPWTVAICGVLTVSLVAYVVLGKSALRQAKPIGEA